jgi:hypothetical protein
MSKNFNLEDIIGSEAKEQASSNNIKSNQADHQHTQQTNPDAESNRKSGQETDRLSLRSEQSVEQFSVGLYPIDKEIIHALAFCSHRSQREVIEILIDEFFKGKENRLQKILEKFSQYKHNDSKGLLE